MKSTFTPLLIAVAAAVTVNAATTTPVRATEYAWCAHGASQGGSQSCTFSTIDQCRAYVSGGGFCQANPRASAFAEMPRRSRRR